MMSESDCAAAETPDFLLAVLERANDAVVIVDRDRHVSFFNAAAERIWGLDRAEVLGRHVSRLRLKELQQVGGDDVPQARDTEITIERKDGSRVRAALSLSSAEAGGQSRIIAFVRDVTTEAERPTTKTATRSGYRSTSRRSVIGAGGSSTYSPS